MPMIKEIVPIRLLARPQHALRAALSTAGRAFSRSGGEVADDER